MLDLMDYADLQLGQTRKGKCPTCGKSKFYVTRKPAGYAFICFRASCSTQGFAGSTALDDASFTRQHTPKWSRQYTGELFQVSEDDVEFFYDRFGVELETPEVASYTVKVTSDDRYAFPLWGPRDEFRGIVLRRPNWSLRGGYPCPRPDRKMMGREGVDDDYPKNSLLLRGKRRGSRRLVSQHERGIRS